MNIEFKQHQLIYAGLCAQIRVLEARCAEHRRIHDNLENILADARADARAEKELREKSAWEWMTMCDSLRDQIRALEAELKLANSRKQRGKKPLPRN